jgi:endoglucanase
MQIADSGLAAASVGIPLRNMHTQVEVAALDDLQQAVEILAEFVCSLKADTELRPFYFEENRPS